MPGKVHENVDRVAVDELSQLRARRVGHAAPYVRPLDDLLRHPVSRVAE